MALDLDWTPPGTYEPSTVTPLTLLGSSCGLVTGFANNPPCYDEPKMFGFAARLKLPQHIDTFAEVDAPDLAVGYAGGASLDRERALWKVAGEAAERYALLMDGAEPHLAAFAEMDAGSALDPDSVVADTQPHSPSRASQRVRWIPGTRVTTRRSAWVPMQLVAVPYVVTDAEEIWRAPITTGAAAARCMEDAIYRGLCEVIERDTFMISWLRQLPPKGVDPEVLEMPAHELELFARTLAAVKRYRLNAEFHALPTALPVHPVICTVWDDAGRGPPVTVGTRAGWNLGLACLGALEEALQGRPWVRRLHAQATPRPFDLAHYDLTTLTGRAQLWLSKDAVRVMRDWLGPRDVACDATASIAMSIPSLRELAAAVEHDGGTVFAVELTQYLPACVRDTGLRVAKVIVPEYQPLYLIESLADHATARLAAADARFRATADPAPPMQLFPHPLL